MYSKTKASEEWYCKVIIKRNDRPYTLYFKKPLMRTTPHTFLIDFTEDKLLASKLTRGQKNTVKKAAKDYVNRYHFGHKFEVQFTKYDACL